MSIADFIRKLSSDQPLRVDLPNGRHLIMKADEYLRLSPEAVANTRANFATDAEVADWFAPGPEGYRAQGWI